MDAHEALASVFNVDFVFDTAENQRTIFKRVLDHEMLEPVEGQVRSAPRCSDHQLRIQLLPPSYRRTILDHNDIVPAKVKIS